MEIQFDFCVDEMTEEQAESLMKVIVEKVEDKGLYLGGGHRPVETVQEELIRQLEAANMLLKELVDGEELEQRKES